MILFFTFTASVFFQEMINMHFMLQQKLETVSLKIKV